jgi:hypothetical protein
VNFSGVSTGISVENFKFFSDSHKALVDGCEKQMMLICVFSLTFPVDYALGEEITLFVGERLQEIPYQFFDLKGFFHSVWICEPTQVVALVGTFGKRKRMLSDPLLVADLVVLAAEEVINFLVHLRYLTGAFHTSPVMNGIVFFGFPEVIIKIFMRVHVVISFEFLNLGENQKWRLRILSDETEPVF